jgi:hypothetical protein
VVDTSKLGEVTVLDLHGEPHRLDALWAGGPTVLVWLRHYG